MKLTPSAAYTILAKGGSKEISWRVYMRNVSTLDVALSGTWTEVTDRIEWSNFPSIASRIEEGIGQFSADAITLTAKGISWFKTNFFDVAGYVELKILFQIEGAADVIPMAARFVDKSGVTSDEKSGVTTFTAFSVEDVGSRMAAEVVSTQFLSDDIDGSSTDGLVLQGITGMYVEDANIASYPLKIGTHQVNYEYNGGSRRVRMDEGAWVSLTTPDTSYTLGDGETAGEDTQRLKIHIRSLSNLSGSDQNDEVIGVTPSTTLPQQWYRNILARRLLPLIYEVIGIDTVTMDTLQMNTYDGNFRVQFYDIPPNDVAITGTRQAIATDGTDLYMAVAGRIYKREVETGIYTRIATIPNGTFAPLVRRMWYNARNNHLWLLYDSTESGTFKHHLIRRLALSTLTLSAEVVLQDQGTNPLDKNSMELVDYNYTGSSYKYGLLFTDPVNDGFTEAVRFMDGTSLTIVDTGVAPTLTIQSKFLFEKEAGKFWYKGDQGGNDAYAEIEINSSGAWIDNDVQLASVPAYSVARFNPVDSRIVYTPSAGIIRSHILTDVTTTTHLNNAGDTVNWIIYNDGKTYFTTGIYNAYSVSGTDAAVLMASSDENISTGYDGAGLIFLDRLYGLNSSEGELFHVHDKVDFIISIARFADSSITQALHDVLNGFNLIGKTTAIKTAFVYRRGDAAGNPTSTGDSLVVNIGVAAELTEELLHSPAIAFVSVANDTLTETYDGTIFGSVVLSDVRKLEHSSSFIPDIIIQDLAFYLFQYFKTDRSLYRIKCGVLPMFHIEPFDLLEVEFDSTQIQKVSSGPIYSVGYERDGSMSLEVLL